MTSYWVRPATARDRVAVRSLARRIQREFHLGERKGEGFRGGVGGERAWVVEAGRGEIVGCCAVRDLDEGEWEVHSLYLQPEWRGIGLGRLLLEKAVRTAQEEGALRVSFTPPRGGGEAERLAGRLGFREEGGERSGRLVLDLVRAS